MIVASIGRVVDCACLLTSITIYKTRTNMLGRLLSVVLWLLSKLSYHNFLSCGVSTRCLMRLTTYRYGTVAPSFVAFFTSSTASRCCQFPSSGRVFCSVLYVLLITFVFVSDRGTRSLKSMYGIPSSSIVAECDLTVSTWDGPGTQYSSCWISASPFHQQHLMQ